VIVFQAVYCVSKSSAFGVEKLASPPTMKELKVQLAMLEAQLKEAQVDRWEISQLKSETEVLKAQLKAARVARSSANLTNDSLQKQLKEAELSFSGGHAARLDGHGSRG
jgi:hypothetical protein